MSTDKNGTSINQQQKAKRRNKADFGPNFKAPDGGYAWVVCVAVGLSNFCIFSVIQQFGLFYKQKFATLGFTSIQITTIVNTTLAVSACSGFLNGPLFRRFSYRQVAIAGGFLSFFGLFGTIFCNSFLPFLISNSIIFALGNGISMSASTFTLYTYFKQERRRASSLAWTITGFAQIVCPYIITYFLDEYGSNGAVLIFSGIILHMQVFALLYQPVKWHTKIPPLVTPGPESLIIEEKCYICSPASQPQRSIYASQYLIAKPTTTSKLLANSTPNLSYCTCQKHIKSLEEPEKVIVEPKKLTKIQKTVQFFDLDLFKDYKFSLIVLGMTLISFADSNFAVLTAFILEDFGFNNSGIARVLVVQGAADLSFRFLTPFLTQKFKFSNRFFFSVSALLMIFGRTLVALSSDQNLILGAYVCIGVFKGIRTVFLPLIIPSYVDLKRLPAANGLSYLCNGLFSLICGPFLGKLKDVTGYRVTIHIMNSLGILALGIWLIDEMLCGRRKRTSEDEK